MKKSILLLKEKLKDELTGKIKSFYVGDPWIIPASLMPCIMINPLKTETNILDNQRDSHVHFLEISLIVDARQYFNSTPEQMVGTEFLMETMEGEDSAGSIDEPTILGVIRRNLNLESNRTIQNVSSIDYTVRRRTEDLITLESTASLQIEYIINRT